jgi:hypothetical protein
LFTKNFKTSKKRKEMSIKAIPIIPLRTCEACGEQYQPVRQKQRFCRQQCHNKWHNSIRLLDEVSFGDTFKILKKNRNILFDLWQKGKRSTTISELQKLGFRVEYLTNFNQVQKTNFVLDMAYKTVNDKVEILKPTGA